jgi:hypothetical protein
VWASVCQEGVLKRNKPVAIRIWNASQHARSQAQYWDIPTLILDFNYQDYLLLIKLVQFGLNFI